MIAFSSSLAAVCANVPPHFVLSVRPVQSVLHDDEADNPEVLLPHQHLLPSDVAANLSKITDDSILAKLNVVENKDHPENYEVEKADIMKAIEHLSITF